LTEKSGEPVKKIEKTARDAVGKNAIALSYKAHFTELD
jgi:hypothetical protein